MVEHENNLSEMAINQDMPKQEKEREYTQDFPPGISYSEACCCYCFPTWCCVVPVGFLIYLITLPFRILIWLVTCCKKRKNTDWKCEIIECEGEAKDTILFVHGWPDCGKMWDS